jgi:hypothetical protein
MDQVPTQTYHANRDDHGYHSNCFAIKQAVVGRKTKRNAAINSSDQHGPRKKEHKTEMENYGYLKDVLV